MSDLLFNSSSSKFSGRFKITKKVGDKVTHDNGWQDNLITDAGLKALAAGNFGRSQVSFVHMSSNNSEPSFLDVAISDSAKTGVYTSETPLDYSLSNRDGNYFYTKTTLSYKVSKGKNYIVSKIHLASSGDISAVPFTSALIKDALGNATTISVLSEEDLYVEYEIRQYFELIEEVKNIVINVRGIDKNFTVKCKPYAIGSEEWKRAFPHYNSDIGSNSADNSALRLTTRFGYPLDFTSSTGESETFPDYNQSTGEQGSYAYDVELPYARRFFQKIKTSAGNYGAGIKYFSISSCRGAYIFEVLDSGGNGIPKTKNDEIIINFNTTVGRY